MTLVDTNVILDIFERDPVWYDWSLDQLAQAGGVEAAAVNPLIVAELSRDFDEVHLLEAKLDVLGLVILPLDHVSAFTAGRRFQQFRRQRTATEGARVLPDFLIGAHALTLDMPLLTRDARLYRRYFPDLTLITPETHP